MTAPSRQRSFARLIVVRCIQVLVQGASRKDAAQLTGRTDANERVVFPDVPVPTADTNAQLFADMATWAAQVRDKCKTCAFLHPVARKIALHYILVACLRPDAVESTQCAYVVQVTATQRHCCGVTFCITSSTADHRCEIYGLRLRAGHGMLQDAAARRAVRRRRHGRAAAPVAALRPVARAAERWRLCRDGRHRLDSRHILWNACLADRPCEMDCMGCGTQAHGCLIDARPTCTCRLRSIAWT